MGIPGPKGLGDSCKGQVGSQGEDFFCNNFGRAGRDPQNSPPRETACGESPKTVSKEAKFRFSVHFDLPPCRTCVKEVQCGKLAFPLGNRTLLCSKMGHLRHFRTREIRLESFDQRKSGT